MTAPASYAEALTALQAQMPRVAKERSGEVHKEGKFQYKYDYADLADVTTALYPVMAALGLSFSAMPTVRRDGRFVLRYRLRHTSGGSDKGSYPLPDPARYGPQDLGKAITYARRYALCAITGLAPGGDDDDASGVQQTTSAPAIRPPGRRGVPAPPATRADADAQGRMSAEDRARHRQLERDTTRESRKATRTRPAAPDPDDPWAADPGPVTPDRAAAIRENVDGGPDPEDRPGSILTGQHRALERLLTMYGVDVKDRVGRHQAVRVFLGLEELDSLTDLSLSQASVAIRAVQDAINDEKIVAARSAGDDG